jgi:hypothetical protein
MTQESDDQVKILFKFYSDVLDEWTVETMWANIVDSNKGLYKLDSIPFYAPLIATDDIVFAEYNDTEQMLTYKKTVTHSGNSTVQVVIMDKTVDVNNIRDIFKDFGCISERVNDGYFSMEVLYDKVYKPIKQKLRDLEEQGIIGYAEPCLSEKHKNEM